MRTHHVFLFLFIGLTSYAQQAASELIVRVENVSEHKGQLMVGLFNKKEHFLKEVFLGDQRPVGQSVMTMCFTGLEPGAYAVSLYHDKNENGKLDANFLGIPNEPYAFSNNAKGWLGPPTFEECLIEINQDKKEIIISL